MKQVIKIVLIVAIAIYVLDPADLSLGFIDDVIVAGILYSIYRKIDVSSCASDSDAFRSYDENMYSDEYAGYDS